MAGGGTFLFGVDRGEFRQGRTFFHRNTLEIGHQSPPGHEMHPIQAHTRYIGEKALEFLPGFASGIADGGGGGDETYTVRGHD